MNQKLLLFAFLCCAIGTFAQRTGDLTIYSNTGKKFYVVLNGVRQNEQPQTNVNISGLGDSWYSCRLIAADQSFNLEKNLGVQKDSVVTYRLVEKKGKYRLRYFSESPLGTAPHPADQVTIVYHGNENSGNNTATQTSGNNSTTVTTTTTTSSGTTTNSSSENVSIGINVNENGSVSTSGQNGSENVNIGISISENGMNADLSVSGSGGDVNSNSQYEETVTTSSSTTTTVNGVTTHSEETTTTSTSSQNGTFHQQTTTTSHNTEGTLYSDDDMSVTMGDTYYDCYTSDNEFKAVQRAMDAETFPDAKLRVAKLAVKDKCLSVAQIKTLASTFDFDDNKMSFVKAAYANCSNQGDYYQLMDLFLFDMQKEELEQFIRAQ